MRRGNRLIFLVSFFIFLNFLTCRGIAESAHDYNVEPAPIAQALVTFAKQSDISIVRPRLSYRDGKTNAIKGHYTLREGLSRLLKGTGFTHKILSPTAVKVIRLPRYHTASDDPSGADDDRPPIIEEIEVSATRRTDFAEKLPYSMSVISGAALDRLRGGSTNDAIYKIAGLSATNQGVSRNKIIIRGLSDGSFSGRTQALVSTYLDNSRMIYNAPEPSFKLLDIASIEVLRGPQGTLYGSGALGGIYRVVTNKPMFDRYEGDISATYKVTHGGAASQEYTAMLNIPVIEDRLAMRGVAYYEEDGGYIDDVRLGLDNVNASELYGGRFAVSLNIVEWLTLTAGINFQHQIDDDTNYYDGALKPLNRDNYLQEPRYDLLKHGYINLDADFSWADLVTNVSWLDRDLDNFFDGTLAVTKLSNLPQIPSSFEDDRHIKTISSETHLSSKGGGKFEWLAGFFLSHRRENLVASFVTPGSAEFAGYGPTDTLYREELTEKLDEIAVFGEATYFLSERFAVTGGMRWFYYNNTAVSFLDDVGIGNITEAMGRQRKNGVAPKFTLSFYASDDRLYYLQVAEGYRLGGINFKGPTEINGDNDENEIDRTTLSTFVSDRLINVELGLKHRLLDGQLRLNGAVFYTDWQNIQSDQFDFAGLPIIGNIGNGRVIGSEIEIAYHPLRAVQLQASAAWNFSELTKVNSTFGRAVGAVKNGPLPGAPAFTMNVAGQYEFSLGPEMMAIIDLSYTYVGAAHLLYKAGASRKSDAYHLGTAQFGVSRGPWHLTLLVYNVFDTKANTFAFGNPFSLSEIDHVTPLRPRSFSLRLGWIY